MFPRSPDRLGEFSRSVYAFMCARARAPVDVPTLTTSVREQRSQTMATHSPLPERMLADVHPCERCVCDLLGNRT
jgi:hypothetical protein